MLWCVYACACTLVRVYIHRVSVQCLRLFCYAVLHNTFCTLLLENISLYFVLQQLLFLSLLFISSFRSCSLHPVLYSIPSFLNMTILNYSVFTNTVYNQISYYISIPSAWKKTIAPCKVGQVSAIRQSKKLNTLSLHKQKNFWRSSFLLHLMTNIYELLQLVKTC
jgi:hypothetical protein